MENYKTTTIHAGLRSLFDQYIPGVYDKLDVPKELAEANNLPHVKLVLDGKLPKTFYRRKPENQVKLAITVMNTFRLLMQGRACWRRFRTTSARS